MGAALAMPDQALLSRKMARRLLETSERETSQLVRELQHEMAQVLTGLRCHLEVIRRSPDPGAADRAVLAAALVDELVVWLRGMALRVRPPMLDDLGLGPTLAWCINQLQQQTGKRIEFHQQALAGDLDPTVGSVVFRVVREALSRFLAHPQIRSARVHVAVDASVLWASIDALAPHGGPTDEGQEILTQVRDRVAWLGGAVNATAVEGMERITVRVPLPSHTEGSCHEADAEGADCRRS